jgi:hypothetical protein
MKPPKDCPNKPRGCRLIGSIWCRLLTAARRNANVETCALKKNRPDARIHG